VFINNFCEQRKVLWFKDWVDKEGERTYGEMRYYRVGATGNMQLHCIYFDSPCRNPYWYGYCPHQCEIFDLAWDNPRGFPDWDNKKKSAVSLPEDQG